MSPTSSLFLPPAAPPPLAAPNEDLPPLPSTTTTIILNPLPPTTTTTTTDNKDGALPDGPSSSPTEDPYLISFSPSPSGTPSPYSHLSPLNWPRSKKWMLTDVLSATGFNRIMVSTIMAPALPLIAAELDMSPTEAAMSMSIYLLATAFGPLFIGPLSEIYGRQLVLHFSSLWFLLWNIICGFAERKQTLIASRFLAGFGASAIYSLAGGVLGDVWKPGERGRSMGVYLLIPLLGAAVGPILGGFITMYADWRWMFWSTSAFQGVMVLVSFFSFPESFAPLLLSRLARKIRKETGNDGYYTEGEKRDGEQGRGRRGGNTGKLILRAVSRPVRLLLFHPIIQVAAIKSGFGYGILYIVLSTFSELWTKQYHERTEISGLHYLAVSLGEILGSQVGGWWMDWRYKVRERQGRKNGPESRLPVMIPCLAITWVGGLMYGWTAQYHVHWLVVDVGVVIMLFGMQMGSMPLTAYVIDAYPDHTASATAAEQFIRSLTAFCFPLFAPTMYSVLGYGWANSVLALAGIIITVPLTIFIWKYGERLRAKADSTY